MLLDIGFDNSDLSSIWHENLSVEDDEFNTSEELSNQADQMHEVISFFTVEANGETSQANIKDLNVNVSQDLSSTLVKRMGLKPDQKDKNTNIKKGDNSNDGVKIDLAYSQNPNTDEK